MYAHLYTTASAIPVKKQGRQLQIRSPRQDEHRQGLGRDRCPGTRPAGRLRVDRSRSRGSWSTSLSPARMALVAQEGLPARARARRPPSRHRTRKNFPLMDLETTTDATKFNRPLAVAFHAWLETHAAALRAAAPRFAVVARLGAQGPHPPRPGGPGATARRADSARSPVHRRNRADRSRYDTIFGERDRSSCKWVTTIAG